MQFLLFVGLLIVGGLLNFIINPKPKFVNGLTMVYIVLAVLTTICHWLSILNEKDIFLTKWATLFKDLGQLLGYLILGYLVVNILFALRWKYVPENNNQIKKIIRSTLLAVSILAANRFILEACSKVINYTFTAAWFNSVGYAIWFLYLITIAEAIGGLGILLHFKLKTGPLATIGLMLIMAGAVYTVWNVGDIYEALTLFVILSLMLVIYYFEKLANSKPLNP